MRKGEEDQGTRALRVMGHILLGAGVALAACLIFLLCASMGTAGGWLKEGLMAQLTVASCVVGSLIGGLVAVGRHGSRALLVGLFVGACLFLLLVSLGFLFFDGMSVENGGGAILAGCLAGGALAGLLGGGRPAKKRGGSRRRRTKAAR